ncbi:hypothetical protein [Jannaschia formosa]|nr:hypothetical protein [Jannaschia formosa]
MSRKTWMDRTIEAARTETVRLPWARTPKDRPAPVKATAKA